MDNPKLEALLGYKPEAHVLPRGWFSFLFHSEEDYSKTLNHNSLGDLWVLF
jgi:hypothetical protein